MTWRGVGDATFEAEGQVWQLRFDFNAMADFEDETGLPALAVLEEMEAGKAKAAHIRVLFWAALRDHHPDITIRQAGRLVIAGMEAFSRAATSAMPVPETGQGEAGTDEAGDAPASGKTQAAPSRAA